MESSSSAAQLYSGGDKEEVSQKRRAVLATVFCVLVGIGVFGVELSSGLEYAVLIQKPCGENYTAVTQNATLSGVGYINSTNSSVTDDCGGFGKSAWQTSKDEKMRFANMTTGFARFFFNN